MHRSVCSQFSEVWSASHLISVVLLLLCCYLFRLPASSCDCTKRGVVCVSQIRAQFPPTCILLTISSCSACRITGSVYKLKKCGENATLPNASLNLASLLSQLVIVKRLIPIERIDGLYVLESPFLTEFQTSVLD